MGACELKRQAKLEHWKMQPPATFVELPSQLERQTGGRVIASIQIGKGKADIYSGADAAVVRAICQVLKSC